MNRAILIGNLANDPESRTTASGVSQCTFRLAVQRRFANPQGVREADFFTIICWRQTAELCARYLAKGRKVAIEGSIQNRSYDAQDGSKRYVTEIIADSVEFLSSRDEGSPSGGGRSDADYRGDNREAPQPRTQTAPRRQQAPANSVPVDFDDDELPF